MVTSERNHGPDGSRATSSSRDERPRDDGPGGEGPGGDRLGLDWALLLHRLPREPSAPRIALWRAIRRLGAVSLGDGLVALPASARNIEHLEWLAAGIEEQGGEASTWVARPRRRSTAGGLVTFCRDAVDGEYRAVRDQAAGAAAAGSLTERRRAVRRLRGELHRIDSRNYFAAPSARAAHAAVEALAEQSPPAPAPAPAGSARRRALAPERTRAAAAR